MKKYYCRNYADPIAEALTGHADIRRPASPAPLLPHSYASASVITDIIVKKYVDALPLYRQEKMWKRLGVDLKRNTMANWIIQTAELYLKPFSDTFLSELLKQAVIHADETVLQVNKEPGREATAESRIWAYASSKRAGRQIRYFRYEESRKGACAEKVLGGYKGVVVSDGYSGYNILSEANRAGCWAHARRKWVEAMPEGATKDEARRHRNGKTTVNPGDRTKQGNMAFVIGNEVGGDNINLGNTPVDIVEMALNNTATLLLLSRHIEAFDGLNYI